MAEHVCPVWMGYLLANPLRRLVQNPDTILAPYIREGMTCLDAGCAMGFFSLPMARLTGPSGTVVCVDFQQKMLDALKRRAGRAGLLDRITTRCCTRESLCLDGLQDTVDFALTMAVIHEVRPGLFLYGTLGNPEAGRPPSRRGTGLSYPQGPLRRRSGPGPQRRLYGT